VALPEDQLVVPEAVRRDPGLGLDQVLEHLDLARGPDPGSVPDQGRELV
jgi:hypothetical protein